MAEDLAAKVDFQKRRDAAIAEMDRILEKYDLGIILTLTTGNTPGLITALTPAIRYYDKKAQTVEEPEPKVKGKSKGRK